MKARLARNVGAVAVALMLLAPTAASADVYHWIKCPACEGTGNSVYRDIYQTFIIATAGEYDIWGEATAEGNFIFTIFAGLDGDGNPINPLPTFPFNSGVDPHQFIATQNFAAQQYYIGADGDCEKPGQGCNVNLLLVDKGTIPPSSVPEPATVLLLGTGLVGLFGVGRLRRKEQG